MIRLRHTSPGQYAETADRAGWRPVAWVDSSQRDRVFGQYARDCCRESIQRRAAWREQRTTPTTSGSRPRTAARPRSAGSG